jgi:transcriptional regulator with XRE-family HTH domain
MTVATASMSTGRSAGELLREWRERRRLSQLDLSLQAEISTRHLSFVETGRSAPSREMILRLAEQLAVPMRERNVLLTAGGYAPIFPERSLADAELAAARAAIDVLLEGHKPYPAYALDRRWNVVASNRALPAMYAGVAPALLEPPVNVARLSLHPDGLAPRIVNYAEWRAHLLARLRREIDLTADPGLIALLEEAQTWPHPPSAAPVRPHRTPEMVIPFSLRIGGDVVSFLSTTMVFGTSVEVTLSELALECFFPADAETAAVVRRLEGLPPT